MKFWGHIVVTNDEQQEKLWANAHLDIPQVLCISEIGNFKTKALYIGQLAKTPCVIKSF